MTVFENYFRPLENLVDGEYRRIKPIDLLIIATYATIIIPLGFIAFGVLHNYTWRHIQSENSYPCFAQKILAANGNARAQFQLGDFYSYGKEEDLVKAAQYYKQAADQGHADAQYWLARTYFKVEQEQDADLMDALNAHNYETAKKYFTLAAATLHDAYYFLGQIAESENKPDEAISYYRLCVDTYNHHGNIYIVKATDALILNYIKNAKAYQNNDEKEKAFEYFKKAADLGNKDAKFEVAKCYETGYGVAPDFGKTLYLLKDLEYYNHEAGTKKLNEYLLSFKAGAEKGRADDMCSLAYLYKIGIKDHHSSSKALELYTKSAELGDQYAQYNLGLAYSSSYKEYFLDQDFEMAKMWFKKSADQGYPPAKEALALILKEEST